MAYNYKIEGTLPEGYPEPIDYAWFPTNKACEQYDIPSFEGYLSLLNLVDRHPSIKDADDLNGLVEILPVSAVEDCTIIV